MRGRGEGRLGWRWRIVIGVLERRRLDVGEVHASPLKLKKTNN